MPEYKIGSAPSAPPQPAVQVVQAPGVNVTVISVPVNYGQRSVTSINLNALPPAEAGAPSFLHQVQALAQHFADEIGLLFRQVQSATHRSPAAPVDVARLQKLIGKSIDPAVASRFMKQLDFDHIGRLIGAKPGAVLRAKDWDRLESAVKDRHLTQTNASGPRDVARTEREVLLDISGQLQRARAQASPQVQNKIDAALALVKEHWLNFHTAGNGPTSHLMAFLVAQFGQDLPAIAASAQALAQEASQTKSATQAYDNTFGRQFESALVHELVKQPPAPVLAAAVQTGDFLMRQVAGLPPQAQTQFLQQLASNLGHDPRPWHAETPDVARFLAAPNLANLEAMLKPAQPNGYDVVKLSWIGVKASISFPPSHPAPWMAQANDNYGATVVSARSQRDALGGLGTKVQTVAAQHIQKDLGQLMAARRSNPAAAAAADQQHGEIRALFDQFSFGANTPAKLGAALAQVEAKYAQSDPQVAGFFAHHRSYLATLPDQQAEFPTVHASLDDFDKKQLKASNAQFTPAQTSGYGTVLAHQPQLSGGAHWGQGLSVQGKTTLDMAQIKAFDANALGHEMNSVNGPSGSTNIMSFLYLQMQKENPALNLQDAFAGTMMFLTFDGGHSLPESVGTFRAITSDTRPTQAGGKPAPERDQIMAQRRQVLETNVLAYGQLDQLFGSPQTATGVAAAVERAWDRTRQSFDEVHAQRTASTS